MNKTIKIGLLFPYSSILSHASHDIIDGFFTAIPEQYRTNFQFYPEYTDKGQTDLVKAAINKMVAFHNVDVISGIISYKVIPEIIPIIEYRKKLAFFFDMGEYLPPITPYPATLFFNSLQMWQLEYALGYWSQKQFNGKGSMLMSVYEAGYHMHSSFWQGAIKAGAEEIDMHILPFDPKNNNINRLLPTYLEKIEKSNIGYLHALFCGTEAVEFYNAFKKSGLYGKIPLIVSPHMASEEILNTVSNLGITFYSASGWNYHAPDKINTAFRQNYQFATGKKASEFAVMGYEMGLAFRQFLPDLQKGNTDVFVQFLKTGSVHGPRGERVFHLSQEGKLPLIDIEKIVIQNNQPFKIIVEQGKAMKYNHAVFHDIHTQSVSGWKNPYLCV